MELQKQYRRKWAGRKGPKVFPEGWLPLFDAFEKLGRVEFADMWTGYELSARPPERRNFHSLMNERLWAKWDLDVPRPASTEAPPGTRQADTSKGQPIVVTPAGPEFVEPVGPNGETPRELWVDEDAETATYDRFVKIWGRLGSLLHSGDIKAKGLGQKSALSRDLWIAEDADDILRSGKFEDQQVLVKEADVKRAIARAADQPHPDEGPDKDLKSGLTRDARARGGRGSSFDLPFQQAICGIREDLGCRITRGKFVQWMLEKGATSADPYSFPDGDHSDCYGIYLEGDIVTWMNQDDAPQELKLNSLRPYFGRANKQN